MSVEATDIEKKSLEAHVELCAERYNALEDRFATVNDKLTTVTAMIKDLKDSVGKMAEKNNDRLITWGIGIIGTLSASLVFLITHYVFK